MKFCMIFDIDRDCLSDYGVVTSGEGFKTSGVGVVHFMYLLFLHFLVLWDCVVDHVLGTEFRSNLG